MTILLVHTAARFSVADVACGYSRAFARAGHVVEDYYLHKHLDYHTRALPPQVRQDRAIVSRKASETILLEALTRRADLVVIISGLNVHPIALWLLARAGVPTAVILTESPYDDGPQAGWVANGDALVATQDRFSADRQGWLHLAPAYDPEVHRPMPAAPESDVLFVGTGFLERQMFLEAVDWTGIQLELRGLWPHLTRESPLFRFVTPGCLSNDETVMRYRTTRIGLNLHRRHPQAVSANPRVYELAACGVCQVSDPREDLVTQAGGTIPVFHTPEELGAVLRGLLADEARRRDCAAGARAAFAGDTFDARVSALLTAAADRWPTLRTTAAAAEPPASTRGVVTHG